MILLQDYLISLPTDSDELASLIYENSGDWEVCLNFLATVAKKQGLILKTWDIAQKIREFIGEGR